MLESVRVVPILQTSPKYRSRDLRSDLIASQNPEITKLSDKFEFHGYITGF